LGQPVYHDFNLNLLNCQNHKLTSEFMDIMYSNMFFPLITRPTTRITSYNATLIDNIFTNNLDNCCLVVCSSMIFLIICRFFVYHHMRMSKPTHQMWVTGLLFAINTIITCQSFVTNSGIQLIN
jgi:hypothetical protein